MRHWIAFLVAVAAVGGVVLFTCLSPSAPPALTLESIPDGVSAHTFQGVDVFLVRKGAEVRGFLDSAPHLGEKLWWCSKEELFVSPAHGEAFNKDGRLIDGPARRDLDRAKTTVAADGTVMVDPRIIQAGAIRNGVGLRSAGVSPAVWAAYQTWIHSEQGGPPFCRRRIEAGIRSP